MNKKLEKLLRSKKPEKGCVQMWTNDKEGPSFYTESIRLIYPNGDSKYRYVNYAIEDFSSTGEFFMKVPCWSGGYEKSSSEAIKKMKAYDKRIGAKSIFLCNVDVEYYE